MPTKRPVVLCADASPDNQMMILDMLLEIDPQIKVASALNGVEAMSFLYGARGRRELPCLVLMDADMPLMNGKQALKLIKKDRDLNGVPIVLFSGPADDMNKTDGMQGVELVSRPIDRQELYGTISRLLTSCRK